MPDLSFQCWTGCLHCDDPGHKTDDPGKPDWYYDDAKTAAEYKSAAREAGWKFMREGRVICPKCAIPAGK